MDEREIEGRIYDLNRQVRSGAISADEATQDYLHITRINENLKNKFREK